MSAHLEFKAQFAIEDSGAITALAWPFATPDRVGDMIMPGAFAKAALPIPMLFGHDPNDPVGAWDTATEKKDGLHLTGRLLVDDVARAREVRALVKSGAVRGVSIGFITRKSKARTGGGRTISDLELLEASLVAIPMHSGARVTSAKSAIQAITIAEAINRATINLKFDPNQPRDGSGRWGAGSGLGANGQRADGGGLGGNRNRLDSQGPIGRFITSGRIGNFHAGLKGAALGAALAVFVDSGAAKYVGILSIAKNGPRLLPPWASGLLFNLMGFEKPMRQKSASVDEATLVRFFEELSEDDAKKLATEILANMTDEEKSDVLSELSTDGSKKSAPAFMAADAITRATSALTTRNTQ